MAATNRRWVLRERPKGMPRRADFELREEPLPEPRDGQFVVRNLYLSCDPAQRSWEFALWGRNLTDELYVSQGLDIGVFGLGNRNYNAPRTFGAELSWNF